MSSGERLFGSVMLGAVCGAPGGLGSALRSAVLIAFLTTGTMLWKPRTAGAAALWGGGVGLLAGYLGGVLSYGTFRPVAWGVALAGAGYGAGWYWLLDYVKRQPLSRGSYFLLCWLTAAASFCLTALPFLYDGRYSLLAVGAAPMNSLPATALWYWLTHDRLLPAAPRKRSWAALAGIAGLVAVTACSFVFCLGYGIRKPVIDFKLRHHNPEVVAGLDGVLSNRAFQLHFRPGKEAELGSGKVNSVLSPDGSGNMLCAEKTSPQTVWAEDGRSFYTGGNGDHRFIRWSFPDRVELETLEAEALARIPGALVLIRKDRVLKRLPDGSETELFRIPRKGRWVALAASSDGSVLFYRTAIRPDIEGGAVVVARRLADGREHFLLGGMNLVFSRELYWEDSETVSNQQQQEDSR